MSENEIQKKIGYLTELLQNPDGKGGISLCILLDLFQITHEGRDLEPQTLELLNEAASRFFSPQLLDVMIRLRLEVCGFRFAALNFIDVDYVIEDLLNRLKSVT